MWRLSVGKWSKTLLQTFCCLFWLLFLLSLLFYTLSYWCCKWKWYLRSKLLIGVCSSQSLAYLVNAGKPQFLWVSVCPSVKWEGWIRCYPLMLSCAKNVDRTEEFESPYIKISGDWMTTLDWEHHGIFPEEEGRFRRVELERLTGEEVCLEKVRGLFIRE